MDQEEHLVMYREQRPLDTIGDNLLLEVGFSSVLPACLKRLNDAITAFRSNTSIEKVSIQLSPDARFPRPIVETTYESGYGIRLDIYPKKEIPERAELQIGDGSKLLSYSSLGDLQALVTELLPDRKMFMYWEPRARIGESLPQDNTTSVDFLTLTPGRLEQLPTRRYSLSIQDITEPLFILRPYSDPRLKEKILGIYQFYFVNAPQEMERAMDLVSRLLASDPFSEPKLLK